MNQQREKGLIAKIPLILPPFIWEKYTLLTRNRQHYPNAILHRISLSPGNPARNPHTAN